MQSSDLKIKYLDKSYAVTVTTENGLALGGYFGTHTITDAPQNCVLAIPLRCHRSDNALVCGVAQIDGNNIMVNGFHSAYYTVVIRFLYTEG